MGLFSKKVDTIECSLLKEENKKMMNQDQKLKSDIKYLESQYDTFVMASLLADFDLYKDFVEGGKSTRYNQFWTKDQFNSDTFILIKSDSSTYSAKNVQLRIDYTGRIDYTFEIKSIKIIVNSTHVSLTRRKFSDIIFKYLMVGKITDTKYQLEETKKSFESMIDVIGKDVRRDLKIEEIFKA